MLLIQQVRCVWSKASRGAADAAGRPRPTADYPIPHVDAEDADTVVHLLQALEREGFVFKDRIEIRRPGGGHSSSLSPLSWRRERSSVQLSLTRPAEDRLRSRWPSHLPSPLITLFEGEQAIIDWNGRFRTSLFGTDRSSYYEASRLHIAFGPHASSDILSRTVLRKHIDLRADIY